MWLDFNTNNLSSLSSGVFDSLTNLTVLKLRFFVFFPSQLFFIGFEFNHISSYPSGLFDHLTQLKELLFVGGFAFVEYGYTRVIIASHHFRKVFLIISQILNGFSIPIALFSNYCYQCRDLYHNSIAKISSSDFSHLYSLRNLFNLLTMSFVFILFYVLTTIVYHQ